MRGDTKVGAVTVVTSEGVVWQDRYTAPTCTATGEARSALFHPWGFPLWQVEAELGEAAEISWVDAHGDEAVYVLDGDLEVDGRRCGPEGAIVVEAGVASSIRAVKRSRIIHMGPVSTL